MAISHDPFEDHAGRRDNGNGRGRQYTPDVDADIDAGADSDASSDTRRSRRKWSSEWDRQWTHSRSQSEMSVRQNRDGDVGSSSTQALLVDHDDRPRGMVSNNSSMTTIPLPSYVEDHLNISVTRHTRTRTFALPPSAIPGLSYAFLEELLELNTPWRRSGWAAAHATHGRRKRKEREPRETTSPWARLWGGSEAQPELEVWVEHPIRSGKWKRVERWGQAALDRTTATSLSSSRRRVETQSLTASLVLDFWRDRMRSGGYTLLAIRLVGSGPPGTALPSRSSSISRIGGLLRRDADTQNDPLPATSLERVGKGLSRLSVGLASLFGALDAVDPQLRNSEAEDFDYVLMEEGSDEEAAVRRGRWGFSRKRRTKKRIVEEHDGNTTDSTAYAGLTDDEDTTSMPAQNSAAETAVQVLQKILPRSWFRATGFRAPLRRRVPTGRLVDLSSDPSIDIEAQNRGEEDAQPLQTNDILAAANSAVAPSAPPAWPARSTSSDRKLRKAALRRDRARMGLEPEANTSLTMGRTIWRALLGRRLGPAAVATERSERSIQRETHREWISPASQARRTLRERLDLDPRDLRASRPLPTTEGVESDAEDEIDVDDGRRFTIATSAALSSYEVFLDQRPPLPALHERQSDTLRSNKSSQHTLKAASQGRKSAKSSRSASASRTGLRSRSAGSEEEDGDPFRYIPRGAFGPNGIEGVVSKDLPLTPAAGQGDPSGSPLSGTHNKAVAPSPDSGFVSSGGPSSPTLPTKPSGGRAKPTAWRFGKTKRHGGSGYASADDAARGERTSLDSASEAPSPTSTAKRGRMMKKKKKNVHQRRGSAGTDGAGHFVGAQVVRRPEDALLGMTWKGPGDREGGAVGGRRASEESRPDFTSIMDER